MEKLKKLQRHKASPNFTRRQWIFKAIQIYLCYLGADFSGSQIYNLEIKYAHNQISAYQAFYAPMVLYYYLVSGFCLANAFWKLIEMYWWGKDHLKALRLEKLQENTLKDVNFTGVSMLVTDDLYSFTKQSGNHEAEPR
jgi:hypothetical protein